MIHSVERRNLPGLDLQPASFVAGGRAPIAHYGEFWQEMLCGINLYNKLNESLIAEGATANGPIEVNIHGWNGEDFAIESELLLLCIRGFEEIRLPYGFPQFCHRAGGGPQRANGKPKTAPTMERELGLLRREVVDLERHFIAAVGRVGAEHAVGLD